MSLLRSDKAKKYRTDPRHGTIESESAGYRVVIAQALADNALQKPPQMDYYRVIVEHSSAWLA